MPIEVGNLWLNKHRSVLSAAEESKCQHCNQTKSYSEHFLQQAVVERRTFPIITFKEDTKPSPLIPLRGYGALSELADFPLLWTGSRLCFWCHGGRRADLIPVKIGGQARGSLKTWKIAD